MKVKAEEGLPDELDGLILGPEQQHILQRVLAGESIFFTGAAGVGKSSLLKAIIKAVSRRYPDTNQVAVTATTGIAAESIGGCTLHSWAGLGLAKPDVHKLYSGLVGGWRKQDTVARWRNCEVLIIDESKLNISSSSYLGTTDSRYPQLIIPRMCQTDTLDLKPQFQ